MIEQRTILLINGNDTGSAVGIIKRINTIGKTLDIAHTAL